MATFLLLIYEDESQVPPHGDPRWQELWDAYVALDEAAKAAGVLVDSQPVTASSTAETVTARGGELASRPGPFRLDTHQLTGYYLLRCPTIEVAREWAAKIPAAHSGGVVEIRQVLEPA